MTTAAASSSGNTSSNASEDSSQQLLDNNNNSDSRDEPPVESNCRRQTQPQKQGLGPMGLQLPSERIEVKLFVGRLPTTATEEEIKPLFAQFGEVVEVAVIRDKNSGAHKGSCFVRMASITEADAAVRTLNNVKILDNALGAMQISYATGEAARLGFTPGSLIPGDDEAKLFVGSLPRDVTEQEVEQFFSNHGKAFDCYLMKDPATKRFRGCCFVKFAMKEEALLAVKRLHGLVTFPGSSRPLEIRIAEPKRSTVSPSGGASRVGLPMATYGMNSPASASPVGSSHVHAQFYSSLGQQSSIVLSNANPRSAGLWKEYFSPDGRPYYHHDQFGITQWEQPVEFMQCWRPGMLTPMVAQQPQEQTQQPQEVVGPAGANVFIFHIPSEWGREDLINLFQRFGKILSAKVALDHTTGRNKGYGFVSFDSVGSAIAAVQNMNLMVVGKKRLRVAIKNGEEDQAHEYAQENGIAFDPVPERRKAKPLR